MNADELSRRQWTTGSSCEIFSNSKQTWFHGKIASIFCDSEGEWLEIRYDRTMSKQIQRCNVEIRPSCDWDISISAPPDFLYSFWAFKTHGKCHQMYDIRDGTMAISGYYPLLFQINNKLQTLQIQHKTQTRTIKLNSSHCLSSKLLQFRIFDDSNHSNDINNNNDNDNDNISSNNNRQYSLELQESWSKRTYTMHLCPMNERTLNGDRFSTFNISTQCLYNIILENFQFEISSNVLNIIREFQYPLFMLEYNDYKNKNDFCHKDFNDHSHSHHYSNGNNNGGGSVFQAEDNTNALSLNSAEVLPSAILKKKYLRFENNACWIISKSDESVLLLDLTHSNSYAVIQPPLTTNVLGVKVFNDDHFFVQCSFRALLLNLSSMNTSSPSPPTNSGHDSNAHADAANNGTNHGANNNNNQITSDMLMDINAGIISHHGPGYGWELRMTQLSSSSSSSSSANLQNHNRIDVVNDDDSNTGGTNAGKNTQQRDRCTVRIRFEWVFTTDWKKGWSHNELSMECECDVYKNESTSHWSDWILLRGEYHKNEKMLCLTVNDRQICRHFQGIPKHKIRKMSMQNLKKVIHMKNADNCIEIGRGYSDVSRKFRGQIRHIRIDSF